MSKEILQYGSCLKLGIHLISYKQLRKEGAVNRQINTVPFALLYSTHRLYLENKAANLFLNPSIHVRVVEPTLQIVALTLALCVMYATYRLHLLNIPAHLYQNTSMHV